MKKGWWIAQQQWNDVLFLHWPVAPDLLRPFINAPFTLDVFNKQAWITAVLLQVEDSRLRGMPKFASYPSFLQLNLRTYVLLDRTPGVFFFMIDTNHSIISKGARMLSIPYIKSQMSLSKVGNTLSFKSDRNQKRFPPSRLSVSYYPLKTPYSSSENILNHWLVERYFFWSISGKRIYQFRIAHEPWKLQKVKVNISMDQYVPFLPPSVTEKAPLAQYTKSMVTNLYPFQLKALLGARK